MYNNKSIEDKISNLKEIALQISKEVNKGLKINLNVINNEKVKNCELDITIKY